MLAYEILVFRRLVSKAVEAEAGNDDGKADDVEDVTGQCLAKAWLQFWIVFM